MKQRRTLVLKRDTLTELAPADLAEVVGAKGIGTLLCLTDQYRQTCLNCE